MLSFIANILNVNFYSFDYNIIKFLHENYIINLEISKIIANLFSLLGEKCILYLLVGIVLFFMLKNKKIGISVCTSVVIMIILCELILKNAIMRVRPFLSNVDEYKMWWNMVSGPLKDSFSCPSSHCAGAAAMIFAIYFIKHSYKILLLGIVFMVFMMYSRIFLMVHYPTDCILGVIMGIISSIIGIKISKQIIKIIK